MIFKAPADLSGLITLFFLSASVVHVNYTDVYLIPCSSHHGTSVILFPTGGDSLEVMEEGCT